MNYTIRGFTDYTRKMNRQPRNHRVLTVDLTKLEEDSPEELYLYLYFLDHVPYTQAKTYSWGVKLAPEIEHDNYIELCKVNRIPS